jgi:hypothetical protein
MKIEYKEGIVQVPYEGSTPLTEAQLVEFAESNFIEFSLDKEGEVTPLPQDIQLEDITVTYDPSEVNTFSLAYLKSTDWYVTRQSETGVEIPAEVSEKRAAAREAVVV